MFTAFDPNVVVYVNNNTSVKLEKCIIEHTGTGGHPIKLGDINPMENTSQEMCIITARERAKLIFTYTLNDEIYREIVYDKIFLTDQSAITISILQENGVLVFKTVRGNKN